MWCVVKLVKFSVYIVPRVWMVLRLVGCSPWYYFQGSWPFRVCVQCLLLNHRCSVRAFSPILHMAPWLSGTKRPTVLLIHLVAQQNACKAQGQLLSVSLTVCAVSFCKSLLYFYSVLTLFFGFVLLKLQGIRQSIRHGCFSSWQVSIRSMVKITLMIIITGTIIGS